MATLSAQIQDLVGSFSDETAMDQWLEDGAKEIINVLPIELQKLCTSMQSFTSVAAGSEAETLNTGKVFSVYAGSVDCRLINSAIKYRAEDSGRIDYATSTDPVYYIESNYINVLPTSLSCKYEEVQYPSSIDADSDSSVSNFPDEAEYLVVLYAAIKALQQQMNTKQGDLPSDPVIPVLESITESLPTWSAPSDLVVPVKPAVPTISSQSISDPSSYAPTYSKPALALKIIPTISDLSITAVLPAVPILSAQTVDDFSSTAPTYTKAILSLKVAPTISDLSITAVPPDVPILTSITFSSIDSAVDATLVAAATSTTLGGSSTAPSYDASIGDTEIGEASTALDNEDMELASARLQEAQVLMQQELSEFNQLNIAFQTGVQEALAEFQSSNQIAIGNAERSQNRQLQNSINDMKIISDNNAQSIQKFQIELSEYQAEVNAQVQEYQQNLSGDIQVWQAERSTDLQKYSSDIQNEMNEFNKENTIYQATIQEKIQEAQLSDANEARKLQKYQAEVSTYSADVNTQVQEYQQNFASDLQVWQAESSTDLQKYGSDIQNELNEFNKENAKYQAILQEYIQEAQLLDTHEARKLQKYQAEVSTYGAELNANVQTFTQALTKNRAAFDTSLQKYTSEVQKVSSANQSKIQVFTGEVGNFTQIIQRNSVDYQWLQSQYAQLKADYQQGLQLLRGGGGSPQPAQQ